MPSGLTVTWWPVVAPAGRGVAVTTPLPVDGDVLDAWCPQCRRPWPVPVPLVRDAARVGARSVRIRPVTWDTTIVA